MKIGMYKACASSSYLSLFHSFVFSFAFIYIILIMLIQPSIGAFNRQTNIHTYKIANANIDHGP